MMTRRVALALTSAALASCARRGDGGVSWWAMGTTGENAPLLLPEFQRASGIRVDLQAVPWTGAHEKLLTGFAGGSLPDVMMLNTGWLPEMTLLGALADPPPALLADQLPGARAAVTIRGRARAVPWTADSWVQFYRRDLLRAAGYTAPPLDWPEWTRMAQALVRGPRPLRDAAPARLARAAVRLRRADRRAAAPRPRRARQLPLGRLPRRAGLLQARFRPPACHRR